MPLRIITGGFIVVLVASCCIMMATMPDVVDAAATATATTTTPAAATVDRSSGSIHPNPSKSNSSNIKSHAMMEETPEHRRSTTSTVPIPWYQDLWSLPPTVPFPGDGWLNRLETVDSSSSAYATLLHHNPLQYPCRNVNAYLNSILFPDAAAAWLLRHTGTNVEWTHYLLCYARNLISGIVVYYGTAGLFHYVCYLHRSSKQTFEAQGRIRPTAAIMWHQIQLAQTSMIVYVMLPVVDEWFIEQQWTAIYNTVSEIGGWGRYVAWLVVYIVLVEMGVYWMHRTLHTNKWLYKHVHLQHHLYKTAESLTPWASIAFHPVDGMLQASPYVIVALFVPCHYVTHLLLLFFTAIWATYIHDGMDWNPIDGIVMGAKYHTIHHTHYMYNYGQVFVVCDWIWGTLRAPSGPTGVPTGVVGAVRPTAPLKMVAQSQSTSKTLALPNSSNNSHKISSSSSSLPKTKSP